MERTAAKDIRC